VACRSFCRKLHWSENGIIVAQVLGQLSVSVDKMVTEMVVIN